MDILGINIDDLDKTEILRRINGFLTDGLRHWIATINPEIAVKAYKDEKYRDILNKADLRVADGAGIIWASCFLGRKLKERIAGVDLVHDILSNVGFREPYIRAMIVGAEKDSREKAGENLRKIFPFVKIGISLSETKFNPENNGEIEKNNKENGEILAELNREIGEFAPDILFVAFGAPRQEQWICDNLPFFSSVKLAIGVGGAIDIISGKLPRAPKIMRKIGTEWLWRFFLEPWRFKRIFSATAVFPYMAMKYKLKNKNSR